MIKRYRLYRDEQVDCFCEIDECDTGDYVDYVDYVSLITKANALFEKVLENPVGLQLSSEIKTFLYTNKNNL